MGAPGACPESRLAVALMGGQEYLLINGLWVMKIPINMSRLPQGEPITILLQEFASGDKSALDRLVPLIYPELRRLARSYMRNERPGHTLQPTALVHEAYARLAKQKHPDYHSRAHFMGVAAQVMRQILIDHARTRDAEKRGGGVEKLSLGVAADVPAGQPTTILAIDEALDRLAQNDSLKARLIEMRFFGGMTAEESAEVLKLPVTEVRRHLRVAQAWLQRELDQTAPPDEKI
jgi:RNA polymerase sigma factor (TIGR02999 family)